MPEIANVSGGTDRDNPSNRRLRPSNPGPSRHLEALRAERLNMPKKKNPKLIASKRTFSSPGRYRGLKEASRVGKPVDMELRPIRPSNHPELAEEELVASLTVPLKEALDRVPTAWNQPTDSVTRWMSSARNDGNISFRDNS